MKQAVDGTEVVRSTYGLVNMYGNLMKGVDHSEPFLQIAGAVHLWDTAEGLLGAPEGV